MVRNNATIGTPLSFSCSFSFSSLCRLSNLPLALSVNTIHESLDEDGVLLASESLAEISNESLRAQLPEHGSAGVHYFLRRPGIVPTLQQRDIKISLKR